MNLKQFDVLEFKNRPKFSKIRGISFNLSKLGVQKQDKKLLGTISTFAKGWAKYAIYCKSKVHFMHNINCSFRCNLTKMTN